MTLFNIMFKDKSNKIASADEAQKLMEEDILKNNIKKIIILEDKDVSYYDDGAYLVIDKDLEQKAIKKSENKGITREQVKKQLQDQKNWDKKFLLKPGEKSFWGMNEAEEKKDDKEAKKEGENKKIVNASDIELTYVYIHQVLTNKNIKSKMRYDNGVIQIYVDKGNSIKDVFKIIKSTKALKDLKIEENDKDIGLVAIHKNIKIAIFNDESSKFAKDFNKRKEMDSGKLGNMIKDLLSVAIDFDKTASSKGAVNWVQNQLKRFI